MKTNFLTQADPTRIETAIHSNQQDGEGIKRMLDVSPAATALQQLQKIANQSPQACQLKTTQQMLRDGSGVAGTAPIQAIATLKIAESNKTASSSAAEEKQPEQVREVALFSDAEVAAAGEEDFVVIARVVTPTQRTPKTSDVKEGLFVSLLKMFGEKEPFSDANSSTSSASTDEQTKEVTASSASSASEEPTTKELTASSASSASEEPTTKEFTASSASSASEEPTTKELTTSSASSASEEPTKEVTASSASASSNLIKPTKVATAAYVSQNKEMHDVTDLIEFTTNLTKVDFAKESNLAYTIFIRIQKKYLEQSASAENGWMALQSAPYEIVKSLRDDKSKGDKAQAMSNTDLMQALQDEIEANFILRINKFGLAETFAKFPNAREEYKTIMLKYIVDPRFETAV